MSLGETRIDKVTVDEIRSLVDDAVPEDSFLEFKSTLPGTEPRNKTEFLHDISAFANRWGGLIIYGIAEDEGRATEFVGIGKVDPDAECLRLQHLCNNGIQPRVPGLGFAWREIDGKIVILGKIGRSWAVPHAVTLDGRLEFSVRHNSGRQRMDLSELRSAFTLAESAQERLRRFHLDRVERVEHADALLRLRQSTWLCIHLIPLISVSPDFRLNLPGMAKHFESCKTLAGYSNNWRIVFDGFLHWTSHGAEPGVDGYGQAFHSGAMESVGGGFLEPLRYGSDSKGIGIGPLQSQMIEIVSFWAKYFDTASVPPPAQLFLTLKGAKGLPLVRSGRGWDFPTNPIDRGNLSMSTFVESWSAAAPTILRPVFDQLWNAAGVPSCPDFEQDGTYRPR